MIAGPPPIAWIVLEVSVAFTALVLLARIAIAFGLLRADRRWSRRIREAQLERETSKLLKRGE